MELFVQLCVGLVIKCGYLVEDCQKYCYVKYCDKCKGIVLVEVMFKSGVVWDVYQVSDCYVVNYFCYCGGYFFWWCDF